MNLVEALSTEEKLQLAETLFPHFKDSVKSFIGELIKDSIAQVKPNSAKRTKPYKVKEASSETGIPVSTLNNKIRANMIEIVEGSSPRQILASEVERLKGLK